LQGSEFTTSTHLHGSASLPQYDGYASDVTPPGFYQTYEYPSMLESMADRPRVRVCPGGGIALFAPGRRRETEGERRTPRARARARGPKMVGMNRRLRAVRRSVDAAVTSGPAPRRLPRRLVQLYAGLVLFGTSMALLVRAQLGVIPWDVLHQGLSRQLGVSMGTVVIAVSLLLLLAWIPLRERPGLGTLSNALVIGVTLDAALVVLPPVHAMSVRVLLVLTGVLLNAVATASYIGVHLGPGPRDGLMTGLVRRTGRSVRLVRTSIEATVVLVGWLLGGTVGLGTVVYALAIGPLVQFLLPRLSVRLYR
jgi:uncharacterized membrane protein YczE